MKSFSKLREACWKGYKAVGLKDKGGRKVPNCVPEETNVNEAVDEKDTVTVDIPLMIRLLELAREDVKTDMELHRIVERLIDIRHKGVLTMDDYDTIASKDLKEDGGMGAGFAAPGPTNVTGPQSGTDPISATAKRMDKKRKVSTRLFKRKMPQA